MPVAPLTFGHRLPGVAKIAVLPARALGDSVVAEPALYALHAAYPHAEIVSLGLDWHAEFLNWRPGRVDRVSPVPPSVGVVGSVSTQVVLADALDVLSTAEPA